MSRILFKSYFKLIKPQPQHYNTQLSHSDKSGGSLTNISPESENTVEFQTVDHATIVKILFSMVDLVNKSFALCNGGATKHETLLSATL